MNVLNCIENKEEFGYLHRAVVVYLNVMSNNWKLIIFYLYNVTRGGLAKGIL